MNQITRTVYTICFPHTEKSFKAFREKDISHLFQGAWTKKQDSLHIELQENWELWVKSKFEFNQKLNKKYPTAGSSEAIREQIVYLNTKGKRLVVFKGEYEGYEAIASSINMPILKINKHNDFHEITKEISKLNKDTDVFFISNPSSIDGYFWSHIYNFLNQCEINEIDVFLDICYIGAARQEQKLDVSGYDCIKGIFWSLSKAFGVYYHRIGGVMLTEENPLLYGNQWFKNIHSIEFGKALLSENTIDEYHSELYQLQKKANLLLQKELNINIINSDVFLLGNVVKNIDEYPWQKEFIRNPESCMIRVCMSPKIEQLIRSNI